MTIFERIVSGEIPCHRVWEDQEFLAFLDIHPVAEGHTLVIPKKRIDPVFSMEDEAFSKFFMAAKRVAERLKQKIACERICMSVVGFEVPHAHIHLIPAKSTRDFPWPGGKAASQADLAKLAEQIRV